MTRGAGIRILAWAFAALFSACAGPTPDMRKEASARMQMGVTYLEQRNLPAAMRELTRAAELDPENPEIDMTLGLAYQARGDLAKAEAHMRSALRKDPDYAAARNNLGNLLSQQGRGDEAIREYEKAVSNVLYPTPEFAYYNMGREYHRRKDFPKAETMYRKAISLNPSFLEAYRGLAMVQGEQGMWNDSVQTLRRTVEMAPAFTRGWIDLGKAYLNLRRNEEAIEAFRSALASTGDPALRSEVAGYLNLMGHDGR